MGNIRPQGLRDIESLVWNMVLKIARGETQAPDALEELMSSIPWDTVEAWGPEDPNRTWFRPGNSLLPTTWSTRSKLWFFNLASISSVTENPTNEGTQDDLSPSAMNSSGQQPLLCSESRSSGVNVGFEESARREETMGTGSVGISGPPAQEVVPPIPQNPSYAVGPESEGGSQDDVNMEDRESVHDTRTPVPEPGDNGDSGGDLDATMSGGQEGGSERDVRMGDGESPEVSTPTPLPRPPVIPSPEVGPEDEGGSRGDVSMEDGGTHPESRTTPSGPEGRGDLGEDGMTGADARTRLDAEDEEHSGRDGPERQGDPDADVTMADAESSVPDPRESGVKLTELNRDDSAGNEIQKPAEPMENRSSRRLREATTRAPAAPEGEIDEDNKTTGSARGKKKEPTTGQKRAPSMPLGVWEIIDVDALVRRYGVMNLICPNLSLRKTPTPLTSTSRSSRRKLRATCPLLPTTERA